MYTPVKFYPRRALFLADPHCCFLVLFLNLPGVVAVREKAALITADKINQGNLIANAGSGDEPSSSSSSLSHGANEGLIHLSPRNRMHI